MTDDSPPSAAGNTDADADDESLAERVQRLHRHLEATAELPIDRTANRWLGEAEAVAADVATNDLDDEVVRERVEKVHRLLSEVDGTGHEDADARLEAARSICASILES